MMSGIGKLKTSRRIHKVKFYVSRDKLEAAIEDGLLFVAEMRSAMTGITDQYCELVEENQQLIDHYTPQDEVDVCVQLEVDGLRLDEAIAGLRELVDDAIAEHRASSSTSGSVVDDSATSVKTSQYQLE